jgi:hypothetical protein
VKANKGFAQTKVPRSVRMNAKVDDRTMSIRNKIAAMPRAALTGPAPSMPRTRASASLFFLKKTKNYHEAKFDDIPASMRDRVRS